MTRGWQRLLAGYPWFRKPGRYPIPAYSEFMPPPRVGRKPCGEMDETLFSPDDPLGWRISETEERTELRPGLEHIGADLLKVMVRLGRGDAAHGISRRKLRNNPFWPAELQEKGAPPHERYVLITALALSRTQDDKGRVRWTLFGSSEQGPARAFERSPDAAEFIHSLLHAVYGESTGFRAGIPSSLRGTRYVLTFEPFARLPKLLKNSYLAGDVHLIPFPGSLLFWGAEDYLALQRELPLAMQMPLLHSIHRHESPGGIRVSQSGWLHERTAGAPAPHPDHGPYRETFQRTHRWAKVRRDENELEVVAPTEDKVTHVLFSTAEDEVELYGKPMARNAQIWSSDHHLILDGPRASGRELRAAHQRLCEGGTFGYRFIYPPMQVGWHQVFWHRPLVAFLENEKARVMLDAPAGYLTAYDVRRDAIDSPIELWPRFEAGAMPKAAASRRTPKAITYAFTARREFEEAYWNTIKALAMGKFVNKSNADCALDPVTQRRLRHHRRDLEPLAQALVAHYRKLGAKAGVIPFHWRTDFPFEWSQGWCRNQGRKAIECDVVVKIPGRNRKRAVIMADHYDTAYMEDVYRTGARIAAPGADDNHSATAALLLAAPIFLQLSREGLLESDIWLVHLTGEEFPADCLGARALTQRIVEGSIKTRIDGVFVLDMIAHNNDQHRDLFQISPGEGSRAMQLAELASAATAQWNQRDQGYRRSRGKRSTDGSVPPMAEYPRLRGEIRRHTDPRSTLYNTDAQIFSDAGLPVVLFMENYDIDRHGYHDSHDTMENIDLDYGSALAAIAIETVALTASGGSARYARPPRAGWRAARE